MSQSNKPHSPKGGASGHPEAPRSVRKTAQALLDALDREADAMLEGQAPYDAACQASNKARSDLADALAEPEFSRAELLPDAHWAVEGIEIMRAQQPGLLPIHIHAIVRAAEAGLQAAGSFELRWAADMRAIERWRKAEPSRDIVALLEIVEEVVIADEKAIAELVGLGMPPEEEAESIKLSKRLEQAAKVVRSFSIEAANRANRELIMPDHADLVVWLLELIDRSVDRPTIDECEKVIADLRQLFGPGAKAAELIERLAAELSRVSSRAFMAELRALPHDLEARIVQALSAELGDSYDCTRVWGAWSAGTMSDEDFEPVEERIPEIAKAIVQQITPTVIMSSGDRGATWDQGEEAAARNAGQPDPSIDMVRREAARSGGEALPLDGC